MALAWPAKESSRRSRMHPAAMSGRADVRIRIARPDEQRELEELQRRASFALGEYNEQLEAHPDAIDLPLGQIERGQVMVAEIEGEVAGFAVLLIDDDHAEMD